VPPTLGFQWQKKAKDAASFTQVSGTSGPYSSYYTITNLQQANVGDKYRCFITASGPAASVMSQEMTVTAISSKLVLKDNKLLYSSTATYRTTDQKSGLDGGVGRYGRNPLGESLGVTARLSDAGFVQVADGATVDKCCCKKLYTCQPASYAPTAGGCITIDEKYGLDGGVGQGTNPLGYPNPGPMDGYSECVPVTDDMIVGVTYTTPDCSDSNSSGNAGQNPCDSAENGSKKYYCYGGTCLESQCGDGATSGPYNNSGCQNSDGTSNCTEPRYDCVYNGGAYTCRQASTGGGQYSTPDCNGDCGSKPLWYCMANPPPPDGSPTTHYCQSGTTPPAGSVAGPYETDQACNDSCNANVCIGCTDPVDPVDPNNPPAKTWNCVINGCGVGACVNIAPLTTGQYTTQAECIAAGCQQVAAGDCAIPESGVKITGEPIKIFTVGSAEMKFCLSYNAYKIPNRFQVYREQIDVTTCVITNPGVYISPVIDSQWRGIDKSTCPANVGALDAPEGFMIFTKPKGLTTFQVRVLESCNNANADKWHYTIRCQNKDSPPCSAPTCTDAGGAFPCMEDMKCGADGKCAKDPELCGPCPTCPPVGPLGGGDTRSSGTVENNYENFSREIDVRGKTEASVRDAITDLFEGKLYVTVASNFGPCYTVSQNPGSSVVVSTTDAYLQKIRANNCALVGVYARKTRLNPADIPFGTESVQLYVIDCDTNTYKNVTDKIITSIKFQIPNRADETIQGADLNNIPYVFDSLGKKLISTVNNATCNGFVLANSLPKIDHGKPICGPVAGMPFTARPDTDLPTAPSTAPPVMPDFGPGTELKKMLKLIGITASPTCSCNGRARQMDIWGCDECAKRVPEILGWLREESERRSLPFVEFAAKQIVLLAIRRARKVEAKRNG